MIGFILPGTPIANLLFKIYGRTSAGGMLPMELGNMDKVRAIDLSSNNFYGSIPPTLAGCEVIKLLNLSNNNLQGEIPDTLQKCSSLNQLDVSFNNLSGEIPRGGVFDTLTFESVEGNHLFKIYGRTSTGHALSFLSDLKARLLAWSTIGHSLNIFFWRNSKSFVDALENGDNLQAKILLMYRGNYLGNITKFVFAAYEPEADSSMQKSVRKLFDEVPQRITISWNAAVQVHVKNYVLELVDDNNWPRRTTFKIFDTDFDFYAFLLIADTPRRSRTF
ncbi:hypothetical protein IEQ34_009308 [Dendrobium chrysotoxum]|uniref:Uncharacterized protein n=1 Tax=Dendrobium chrysotoxum TaxID=161865 RepID=A0AAV7H1H5_DENCH|nr:hypothetical protein IEQ34_009308 [Dendrobium chrysotoxum]